MKNKAGLGIVGLVGVVVIGLALAAQYGRQLAPGVTALLESATVKPGTSTATTTPPDTTTAEPATPLPSPTPTPTEGEKAAAAVGQEYIAYRSTQTECEQTVDGGEVEACVWLDSAQLITRPEWELLFPDTDFYLLEMGGYRPDSLYRYDSRRRLAAWQDGRHYTAKTFDRLLEANGIAEITDENRELVAKAFVLMTLPDYLEEEVALSNLEEGDWQAPLDFRYDHALTAWTKIQGLKIMYLFMFDQGRLRMVAGQVTERNTGDYINVPFERLPLPAYDAFSYSYWRR